MIIADNYLCITFSEKKAGIMHVFFKIFFKKKHALYLIIHVYIYIYIYIFFFFFCKIFCKHDILLNRTYIL